MKLTEKQIAALEAAGFNRWTKGSMDRLYINADTLGLELDYYKSGNISGATYRGETISHKRGGEMKAAKTYIDVNTGELHGTNWTLEQDARQLYEETMEALEAPESEEEEEEETMYTIYTEIELMYTQHIDSLEGAREIAAVYEREGHDWEIRDEETGETIDSYSRPENDFEYSVDPALMETDEQLDTWDAMGFRLSDDEDRLILSRAAITDRETLEAYTSPAWIDRRTGELVAENEQVWRQMARMIAPVIRSLS